MTLHSVPVEQTNRNMFLTAVDKVYNRHEEDTARQLLVRGFQRIGLAIPEGDSQELILKLAECVATMDSTKAELARRIVELHRHSLV